MMLKLTEHVGIIIFLLYKQNPGEILIFRTYSEILNFCLFFAKSRNIQVRHVFMTS